MVQFGSYLFQMITIEELSSKLPPIGDLLAKYHINADIAFFLARPMFAHLLQVKEPNSNQIVHLHVSFSTE